MAVLLEANADPNVTGGGSGSQTPLIHAAMGGHVAVVDMLAKAGADPRVRDDAQFDATKCITTADLRFAVATRRGLAASQVRFFCGEQEVSDDALVLTEHLSVVLLHEPEPLPFPAML